MDEGLHNRPGQRAPADDVADQALLRRIGHGDRAALRDLYTAYYHPLLRFIYRITGRLDLAEEGVNDTMMVVWRSSQSFGHRSRVSTWIMGIAYRKALKLRLRLHKWVFRFKAADWTESIEPVARIEGLTDQLVIEDLLFRALKQLPPKQRAVIELAYYSGYAYGEIAEIVGCPENTVKTRMFHARSRLQDILRSLGQHDASTDYDS
jgi:RNA polymerase sigma-70 factor (ECF subfamily)